MVATAIGIPEKLTSVVESFDVFCDQYARIEDKRSRRAIPFDRYPDQRRISELLADGKWLVCLKARQCGITWLTAAYTLWCMLTKPNFEAVVLQQDKSYAKAFLRRVRFIYKNLPDWMKVPIKSNSRFELAFRHPDGESILTAIAGSDAAGRSMTVNLIIFDEHAYIPQAQESREGCEFSVERSDGQIVSISTAAGPYGDFYEVFTNAPENKYYPVFLPWRSVPDRTDEWYAAEVRRLANNPVRLKRELPNTPAEAFMYAEGRCYPGFDAEKHVRTFESLLELGLRPRDAERVRGVDFGGVAPFACLWIAHWKDANPGFTMDPSCVNLHREMLAYHFDEKARKRNGKDRPVKLDDHACFPAGTVIETLYGPQSIDQIKRGDIVRSHRGWALVEVGATETGTSPLVQVTLEDGRWVRCTPDHPFALADGGFCRADAIEGHEVCVLAGDRKWRRDVMAARSEQRPKSKNAAAVGDKKKKTRPSSIMDPGQILSPIVGWDMKPDPSAVRDMPVLGMNRMAVKSVEVRPEPIRVYSIATEHGTHLANGILVSNCDALRYAVMFGDFQGHVHVYRELYVEDSVGKGRTDLHDIDDIHKLSGWVPGESWEKVKWKPGPNGESFEWSVADRALPKVIVLYNDMDIALASYAEREQDIEGATGDDVMDGIHRLNTLIDGTLPIRKTVELSVEQRRELNIERELRGLSRLSGPCDLQEAAFRDAARQDVLRKQKARERRSGASRYRPYGRNVA